MDDEKIFDLMEKMYIEITGMKQDMSGMKQDMSGMKEDISGMKQDMSGMKEDISGMKQDISGMKQEMSEMSGDIKKLGVKIDGEITDKLKILCDEQTIMRKEIAEINQDRTVEMEMIKDMKLSIDVLSNNQNDQKSKIIELDKRIVK